MRKLTMIAFLLVCTGLLFAQTAGKVSGTVSSEDGQPLAGANVVVEGTSFGAAAGDDMIAVFGPAGFVQQIVRIGNIHVIAVQVAA